jgi:hypothetical protein
LRRQIAFQIYQPGVGVPETAFSIKFFEMRFEIDVQPIDTAHFRRFRRSSNQPNTDAAPPVTGVNRRVENKSVLPAVPRDVYKTDQP